MRTGMWCPKIPLGAEICRVRLQQSDINQDDLFVHWLFNNVNTCFCWFRNVTERVYNYVHGKCSMGISFFFFFSFCNWQVWTDLLGFIALKYFRDLVCSFTHSIPKNAWFNYCYRKIVIGPVTGSVIHITPLEKLLLLLSDWTVCLSFRLAYAQQSHSNAGYLIQLHRHKVTTSHSLLITCSTNYSHEF